MSLKKLFWNSGEEEIPPDTADEALKPEQPPTPVSRPAVRVPTTTNPLAALRTGPTASLFTRATGVGVQAVTAALSSSTSANHSAVDKEFDSVIADALEQDAKASGFKEFMAQLTALSAILPDRGQCVKAALAAVTAINPSLNATVVARAIGERLKLLSDYEASYNTDSRNSESGETAEKRSAISEIDTRLHDIDAEIQRLAS